MTTNNYVDANGLHTQTLPDLVTQLTTQMKGIYGQDINVESNSPDGQMINIFSQAVVDTTDCITQVYNSMDPDTAVGEVLDQRVALNGIVRRGATYTRTNVVVTATSIVAINGVDTAPNAPFTVQDTSGNLYVLEATTTLAIGSNTLEFRAATAGLVQTTPNTITKIVTITLGVSTVNNPTSAIETGVDEETDPELRLRRSQSVSLPSTGYLAGLIGALNGINNVVDSAVRENNTGTTDIYGIPAHSIWCIVDGGANADIAQVIYNKRNAGCGMRGTVVVSVTQPNGVPFPVKFDRPLYANLYINITVESIDPTHTPDGAYLAQQIYNTIQYTIYQPADFTAITTLVKELDPLAVVIAGGVSGDNVTFSPFLYPATVQTRWLNSVSRIIITVV